MLNNLNSPNIKAQASIDEQFNRKDSYPNPPTQPAKTHKSKTLQKKFLIFNPPSQILNQEAKPSGPRN